MVLITDIALQFITTELVPKIVSKTVELSKKGTSIDDIVAEICSSDFADSQKGSVKRSISAKAPPAPKPMTIDEYMEEHKDSQVCIYVFSRGENKGKICCKPVTSSSYNKDDKKTQRCTQHENSAPGPDIDSLLAKTKTPSKTDQVAKMRKTFPKGAPEVLNTPTESKAPSGLGKISIKDQLQKDVLKIDTKTPREDTPVPTPAAEKRKLPPSKARVVSPTPPKSRTPTPDSKLATRDPTPAKTPVRTPSPEPRSSTSSCNQTPVTPKDLEKADPPTPVSSHHESTPETEKRSDRSDQDESNTSSHVIPKDENDEEYFLNPTHPSAQDYLWMMYSYNEALLFSKEFDACYGVYRTDEKINPDKDFKVSSAWKKLLKPPTAEQLKFFTDRDIALKSID